MKTLANQMIERTFQLVKMPIIEVRQILADYEFYGDSPATKLERDSFKGKSREDLIRMILEWEFPETE